MKKLPGRNLFCFTVYVEEYIYEEDIFYSERISHFHMSFISDDDAEEKRYCTLLLVSISRQYSRAVFAVCDVRIEKYS